MAQIKSIVSEALQAQIRRLLPSQQGFDEDLQASNVIVPIIDLTNTAEGTGLPVQLQQAQAFGSQTAFSLSNSSAVLNTTGFYLVQANISINTGAFAQATVTLSDGLSNKVIYNINNVFATSAASVSHQDLVFTVFLGSGESCTFASTATAVRFTGSYRQIADVNGNLVNPSGYTSQ